MKIQKTLKNLKQAYALVSKMSEYEGKLAEANIEAQMLDTLYNQIKEGKNFNNISWNELKLIKLVSRSSESIGAI